MKIAAGVALWAEGGCTEALRCTVSTVVLVDSGGQCGLLSVAYSISRPLSSRKAAAVAELLNGQ